MSCQLPTCLGACRHTSASRADVLKGGADCQQASGGGSEDGDALAAEIEDEEALLEAACDAVPALAVAMSPVGILPLWKVRFLLLTCVAHAGGAQPRGHGAQAARRLRPRKSSV